MIYFFLVQSTRVIAPIAIRKKYAGFFNKYSQVNIGIFTLIIILKEVARQEWINIPLSNFRIKYV
jgi:hypothetical protein